MNFPKVVIGQYSDEGDKDDGAYYLYLLFRDDLDFDFGFNSEIGKLLGLSFHKTAKSHAAYVRKGGRGNDYFFPSEKDAEACASELNAIVKNIRGNENKFSVMKKRYYTMLLADAEKSKEQGFLGDYARKIENMEYLKACIE